WHRIKLLGKQAESLQDYLKKGKQIYVEGRLETRSWDDKDGQKKYMTEIIADRIQLLGGRGDGGGRSAGRGGDEMDHYEETGAPSGGAAAALPRAATPRFTPPPDPPPLPPAPPRPRPPPGGGRPGPPPQPRPPRAAPRPPRTSPDPSPTRRTTDSKATASQAPPRP